MEDAIFYLDWVALGIIIGCEFNMIHMSYKAYQHYKDDVFPRCIKAYISWVTAGAVGGVWLLFSHAVLKG